MYAIRSYYDWALVCCGHSHKAEARRVPNVRGGESWLVNPDHIISMKYRVMLEQANREAIISPSYNFV